MSKFQVGDRVMSPGFGYGTVVTNAPDAAGDILVAVGSGSSYNYVLTNESDLTLVPDTVMVELRRETAWGVVEGHVKVDNIASEVYGACRKALGLEL